jgi:hypothetical protein
MPCIGALAALLTAACDAWSAPASVDESSRAGERPFAMGFLPIPRQPLSQESWLETWDQLLKRNAEFVRTNVEVDWEDFLESPDPQSFGQLQHLTFAGGMAKRTRLKSLLVITPTDSNTGEFYKSLPKRMGNSFGDKQVRQAFANCTIRIAKDYKPEYLALGNEINSYFKRHPDDVANFFSLYEEIYTAVKKVSPATRITISLQYELLTGTFDGTPQWTLLDQFGAHLDVLAISTYPSPFFGDPARIPDDYYTQLSRHGKQPVIVVESGWPTQGNKKLGASPENQDRFLTRFVELTAGLDLDLWIWWFLHDWDGEGYPDFFKSMGLRTANGIPKPSWQTWQEIHSRRLSAGGPGS